MSEYIYEHVQSGADHMGRPVEQPTLVQREEIVRYRDCKHYRPHEFVLFTDIEHVCLFWADGCKVEPNGFCAWAKRKEGGDG